MSEWHEEIRCPECGSSETHFIEVRNDLSVFECEICGCRFEIEESD
ncbi:MAG: hypothetical protein PHR11_00520 [Candidatus Omnitrophica bacterium]|nr:hypothetical protein [Candidatus Omnitrophota bacterium]